MNVQKHAGKISVVLKSVIVLLACWYIGVHFSRHPDQHGLINRIGTASPRNFFLLGIVLLLMPFNWLIESYKWKLLASHHTPITLRAAIKGVLAGVTIGTATPNRVGEFAGRIFSVNSDDKKNLLVLSFVASLCQVMVTVIAGVVACLYQVQANDTMQIIFLLMVLVALILVSFPFIAKRIPEGWKVRFTTLRDFSPALFIKILGLSAFRYSVYVTQFFLLLKIGMAGLDTWTVVGSIAISYLVITIIPTFAITEIFVRGSVAGFFIGNDDQLSNIAFIAAGLLWTINVAIPSLAGMYFVFRLKFFRKS